MSTLVETPHGRTATPVGSRVVLTDVTEDARRSHHFSDHEVIWEVLDPEAGLHAFIAIHNTRRGPALGGCRMWPYASTEDALDDALRLSHGMSLKAAVVGLKLGGGKAVVIGDPAHQKTPELLHSLGDALEELGGKFVTGEDVGITVADVALINERTKYVVGTAAGAGDPSPITAYGVFCGIEAAAWRRLRTATLKDVSVAVQGLGKVGYALCELLHDAGAKLVVSDIDPALVAKAKRELGAKSVAPDEIAEEEVDVYAPCALGGVIDDTSLPKLRCKIVAGAANNQLAEDRHGEELHQRGILYAPDYVINAGGLIAVAMEHQDREFVEAKARARTAAIGDTLNEIFARAEREGSSPVKIADAMAAQRLLSAPRQKG